MKVEVTSFRGEVPRLTPRALPENAAQSAINPRLLSGDLEAWRQFTLTHTLANPSAVQSVYLLNDAWLSWTADVDAARGAIPGDDTYRLYLTGPDVYTEPRFTNYALATTGAEPYPVTTRPLGVPAPESVPTVVLGVDSTPTTFSVDTLDDDASLATSWSVNPPLTGATYATVTQGAGYYLATYDENRNNGEEAYAYRDFGVGAVTVLQAAVDFYMTGDTGYLQASMIVGAGAVGDGVGVVYENGVLSIRKPSQWGINFGTAVLGTAPVSPALSANTFYSLHVTVVLNADGTKTVTASIRDSGSAELATLTLTNNFSDGDYCGFANGAIADAASQFQTRYSNYHVQASGSAGYVPANIATSYVFTFVNDLGEESAPSEASATVVRPDGVSATVTTPTAVQSGATGYSIDTKRIYRAATGNTGTEFRFVAEIPLSQADYVDVLTDVQLGEVLESTDWDLPPDDLRGILALPNGIMVGFRRNQLCFSAQNRPHAWPVSYRLNTDTDIVGIGNIDTTVVIGTEAFPYLAIGSDPATYSMTKLEVPQACVSKRSFAYLTNIGVVFASPDGLIAVAGSGQVRNLTEKVFTRKQWQALGPETILGVAHDDVYHFFYEQLASGAHLAIDSVAQPAIDGSTFTLTITRSGSTAGASIVTWTASGDIDGATGFQRVAYSGTLTFSAGETTKALVFTLSDPSGVPKTASVVLSDPSSGTVIDTATGTMTAEQIDLYYDNVVALFNMRPAEAGLTPLDTSKFANVYTQAGADDLFVDGASGPLAGGSYAPMVSSGSTAFKRITHGPSTDFATDVAMAFTMEGFYRAKAVDGSSRQNMMRMLLQNTDFLWPWVQRISGAQHLGVDKLGSSPLDETFGTDNTWIHYVLESDGGGVVWLAAAGARLAAFFWAPDTAMQSTVQLGNSASAAEVGSGVDVGPHRLTFGVARYGLASSATYTVPTSFPEVGP